MGEVLAHDTMTVIFWECILTGRVCRWTKSNLIY